MLYIKNHLCFYFNFLNMYFYDNWEGHSLIYLLLLLYFLHFTEQISYFNNSFKKFKNWIRNKILAWNLRYKQKIYKRGKTGWNGNIQFAHELSWFKFDITFRPVNKANTWLSEEERDIMSWACVMYFLYKSHQIMIFSNKLFY